MSKEPNYIQCSNHTIVRNTADPIKLKIVCCLNLSTPAVWVFVKKYSYYSTDTGVIANYGIKIAAPIDS